MPSWADIAKKKEREEEEREDPQTDQFEDDPPPPLQKSRRGRHGDDEEEGNDALHYYDTKKSKKKKSGKQNFSDPPGSVMIRGDSADGQGNGKKGKNWASVVMESFHDESEMTLEKEKNRTPQHPSRRYGDVASGGDNDGNDALEYYDPKKAKAKRGNNPRNGKMPEGTHHHDGDPVDPSLAAPSRRSRASRPARNQRTAPPPQANATPGAFRMRNAPPSLTSSASPMRETSSRSILDTRSQPDLEDSCSHHSRGGNSMVVIPNASLVIQGDPVQEASVSRSLPELVHAAPLDIDEIVDGIVQQKRLQEQQSHAEQSSSRQPAPQSYKQALASAPAPPRNSSAPSRTHQNARAAGDASTQVMSNDTEISSVTHSAAANKGDRVVLVLNKRWLILIAILLCLVFSAIIAGVVYAVAQQGGSGNDESNSSSDKRYGSGNRSPSRNNNNNNRNLQQLLRGRPR